MAIRQSNAPELPSIPNFAQALSRMLNPYEDKDLRVPFYLYSDYRTTLSMTGVTMQMNPQNVDFRQGKRITRKDTQSGANFFHWTDDQGKNNDILELEFSGQTGNINLNRGAYKKGEWNATLSKATEWVNDRLQGSYSDDTPNSQLAATATTKNVAGAIKLLGLWDLYKLTSEPVRDIRTGRPLFSHISYTSPMMANSIINFTGHFSRVLDLNDNAGDPFSKRYTFGFTVLSSDPPIDELYQVIVENLSRDLLNDLRRPGGPWNV